ncbi:DNA helicase INO80, partial [Cucurbita argyrosperma subsp. argyrosperma]
MSQNRRTLATPLLLRLPYPAPSSQHCVVVPTLSSQNPNPFLGLGFPLSLSSTLFFRCNSQILRPVSLVFTRFLVVIFHMDRHRQSKDLFYSNLFNLEFWVLLQPLVNFQLPQPEDDFDYYANSSHDESRGSPGRTITTQGNGTMTKRELSLVRKRRQSLNSEEEDDGANDYYGTHVTEERYRQMLGEHIKNYKRRSKHSSPMPARMGNSVSKGNSSLRARRSGSEQHEGFLEMETANDYNPHRPGIHHDPDFASLRTPNRVIYEPAYLDIGDGIIYKIPPTYDKLAASLNLPSFSDIQVEEVYLEGTLDLGSLASMIADDKRFGNRSQAGMGDPRHQYESLQARLDALSASNSSQKFSLKVSDIGLNSSIPEGAAGSIKRAILSEGGMLQIYYVKVLEKGDTYEIIERSLPKKQNVKKDPSVIEREEMEKIGKIWVNIVRRDLPKHHRNFTAFHRKQLIDAKRSLKMMRGAAIRTRKLARDMLLFWKRIDKEMAEVRKREEREAAEALRREQELREAKRQQQRLNFLIQQTELYSHFMQNKSNLHPSEALPLGDEKPDYQEGTWNSDSMPAEEEDPEEAELKKEALRVAQDAVSKQKRLTSAFDDECSRLRQASEPDPNEVAGANNIDLLHPSTMPVTSTVQTPELFKGSLKEYQLKGLQWLVNCYEQGLNGILADEMGLGKTIQAMVFLAHLAEDKNIWGPFLVVAPASVLNNWVDEINRFCPDLKALPYWGGVTDRAVLRKKINPKNLYRRDAGFHILVTNYQLLVADEKYFRRVKWQYMVLDEAQAIKSSTSIRWKTLLSFNCRNRLLLTGTPVQNNMAELWALLHFIMPTLFDSHEQFNEWFSKGSDFPCRIENHAEHGGTLNEHQLNRLHSILKPFMLRRVKKDVVSELTKKTEITVHCKLSSRQQAFYQAIKNKISLAGLFDSNRHINGKKALSLMNIVIQLRKVCNHPELFERNEGSTYLYFADIPNPLLPPPFGELDDVHYSGGHNPIEFKERLQSNVGLLHAAYTFIPRTRAPPIGIHCSDRSFTYQTVERLHDPWVKRLFIGFARTSDFNGPGKPNEPHPLIQEIDSEIPVSQPALQLTYSIFGSSPPMQSFDPAKLLTDSGKLQTLDILLKRLRAENHRVLLFAQMTKMLNILEDYMNYRKYKYLRLDGSSTIMDRRDMVREFQLRNDIFVFLLSTRAGGLGINLTAADTVIFYENDWNPTLDLQAMDRAHRLGQTKDVTVYRLICKETVEEKILERASQKNTVQQLVMTGGHVQGDILAPEEVVSLLLDDAQLEQKLREMPFVRKGGSEKQSSSKARSLQNINETTPVVEFDLGDSRQNVESQTQKPKRPKRPTKSVNGNLVPATTSTNMGISEQTQYPQ